MHEELLHTTHLIAFVCSLLILLTAVAHYSRRSWLPAEAWILIIGLGAGLTDKYTAFGLSPYVLFSPGAILVGILPLLIFASGRRIYPGELKGGAIEIAYLAVPGVLLTAGLFGGGMAWILEMPLVHGFVLGASVGATDPAAVVSIMQRFRLPKKLNLIVEGESLFNDGTTVVLFSVITGLALEGSVLNLFPTMAEFLWSILAAIPAGLLLGRLGAGLLRVWHEHHVFFTTSMSLILAYGSFILAEEALGASGVICVLMAALTFAHTWQSGAQDRETANKAMIMEAFWDYIARTLTGFLFFMLGVAVGSHEFVVTFWSMVAAVLLLALSRLIIIYGGFGVLRIFRLRLPLQWLNILSLSGLRGPVSAALILTIPERFPYKGEFQCLAFVVIAAGLIIQPVLIQLLLRRSKSSLASS